MITLRKNSVQTGLRQKSITKYCRVGRATQLVLIMATGLTLSIGVTAAVGQQAWDTAGPTDSWNIGDTNWDAGATFTPGNAAIFGGTGETVTVDEVGGMQVGDITFDADGYTINGNQIDLTGNITVTNAGETAAIDTDVQGGFTLDGGGTLQILGAVTGAVTVNTGGTLDIDDTVTGAVTNNGTVELAGDITGDVNNNADFDVDGASSIGGSFDTSGDTDVTADLTVTGLTTVENGGDLEVDANLTGAITVNTGGTLDIDDTVTGAVTNNGTVELAGDITGDVNNNADFDVDGASSIGGSFDTSGDTDVTADLTVTGLTTVENGGDLEVDANLTGAVTVNTGGTLDIDDTVTGAVTNNGTVELAGDITGDVNNNADFDVDGASSIGGLFNNAGTVTAEDDLTWGTALNTGTFDVEAGVSVGATSGLLTNQGTLNLFNGASVDSAILHSGTMVVSGAADLTAGLSGSGTIDLQDGAADDALTITGDVAASGLTFNIDADMSSGGGGTDTINITGGALTGDFTLSFTDIGPGDGSLLGGTDTVLSYDTTETNSFTYDVHGLGAVGTTIYFIDDTVAGSLALASLSDPNLGGFAGAVVLTQSIIGGIVNRPSSPYVVGLAIPGDDPCGPGVWGRQVAGIADANADITSTQGGNNLSIPSEVSASYAGYQLGLDMNCSGGYYNGWDMSYGGIIGYNEGNTTQPVFNVNPASGVIDPTIIRSFNNTDFSQAYAGAYVSAFKDGLLLDLQYRADTTSYDLDNTGTTVIESGGIVDQTFNSQTQTLGGSASYQFNLNEEMRLNLTPTIGFSFSETSVDPISIVESGGAGILEIDDFQSRVGFAGVTLSRTIVDPGGDYANTLFGTLTHYNDFAGDISASTTAGSIISTPNLGGFSELSLGMNYIQLLDGGSYLGAKQLNASVRVDGKFSDDVSAWGITGQLRLDF